MIFKYPNGDPFHVIFLTSDLLEAVQSAKIPLLDLHKIHSYHDQLTFHQVAAFIAVQQEAAKLLGVEMPELTTLFGEGYNGGMVEQAFNEIDSNSLREHLIRSTHFKSISVGQSILLVIEPGSEVSTSGWDHPKGRTLSLALQQTLYEQVGYLKVHHGKVIHPAVGVFSMANVYEFVSHQNP